MLIPAVEFTMGDHAGAGDDRGASAGGGVVGCDLGSEGEAVEDLLVPGGVSLPTIVAQARHLRNGGQI